MGEIELGDEVQDVVTGFKGIVIGISTWLGEEPTIGVRSQTLAKNGLNSKAQWYKSPQVRVVTKSVIDK